MTAEEHALLIAMFTRQAILLKAVVKILESHGVPISKDVEAFDHSLQHQESFDLGSFWKTAVLYQEVGKTLGLDVSVQYPAS